MVYGIKFRLVNVSYRKKAVINGVCKGQMKILKKTKKAKTGSHRFSEGGNFMGDFPWEDNFHKGEGARLTYKLFFSTFPSTSQLN